MLTQSFITLRQKTLSRKTKAFTGILYSFQGYNTGGNPHQEFLGFLPPAPFPMNNQINSVLHLAIHLRGLGLTFCRKEGSTYRNVLARCVELINRLEKLVFISKKVETES